MEFESTAGACPASLTPVRERISRLLAMILVPATVISLVLLAWLVRTELPYTSGSDPGYWLGVTGGSLMLVLLIYPLRKRFRSLSLLGPLKYWFRFHMLAGMAGPVIVLFHSTFRIGSFNAAIALVSMLLVVTSGIVGRYIYRKIHHGLYGSRVTVAELQKSLTQQMETLQPALEQMPAVAEEVSRFAALVSMQPHGHWTRLTHFTSLGWKRYRSVRRVRRAIHDHQRGPESAELHALADNIDITLQAIQRAAQFSTYERLFSLWHVIHIPFLCMLVITAIVHVVAVHAY